ncbi:MAG: transglutaminase-like domain-containing protein [Methanobrevibacter arboriphilus]|nr:transglutaminase-like domain-containing protein [Methanobrevibacter arboriphilus]
MVMLSLFFLSIGVTFASDVNYNENVNFEDKNILNNVNNEIYDELDASNVLNSDDQLNSDANSSVDPSNTSNDNLLNTNNSNTLSSNTNVSSDGILNTNTSNLNTSNTTSSNVNSSNINSNNLSSNNTTNQHESIKSDTEKKFAAGGDERPSKLTQSQILNAASSVYKYIKKYKKLPNYVTIAGYKFSMPEFLYLISVTTYYKHDGKNSQVTVKYGISNPSKPTGVTIKGKLVKSQYYTYSKNLIKFMKKYNKAPNYLSTKLGKMQYQTVIYQFSKLLNWSNSHNSKFPKYLSLNIGKKNSINKYIPKYSRASSSSPTTDSSKEKVPSSILNSKYNGESLTKYLNPSKNCQSTNAKIQSLATSITKGYTTQLSKAKAIFNWVRDKVSYSFYYNTKKGATGTLSSKSGNCVDKTHLLIALLRSSGIAARYANGQAQFTSGNTYGHVWAQVLIGDTWVVADTTSSRNSFGVVNNWKPSSAKIYGYYSSISF